MAYSRHIAVAMLFSLVFPAACSHNAAMLDPVAQSGASSEEIWYRYGGARVAYTAVARPKQLTAGYGAAQDPALYAQVLATTTTTTTQKAALKKRSASKTAAAPPRPPDCPPCPPTGAAPSVSQIPLFSAPPQGAARPAPLPPAPGLPDVSGVPGSAGLAAPPPSPPKIPLPALPPATPAPMAPDAPGG